MPDIYQILKELNIAYKRVDHASVYTVADTEKMRNQISGLPCKNLFLRDSKGKKHWLVVTKVYKKVDLFKLSKKLGGERLSFASPERLKKYLELEPGAVSPFGIINDTKKEVIVVVDSEPLLNKQVSFHPNINTATLILAPQDFKKFLNWSQNKVKYIGI